MEYAPVRSVFAAPMHPYTLALKNAFPDITRSRSEPLISIPKSPPVLIDFPNKCRFASRCPFRTERCMVEAPEMQEPFPGHFVACHHLDRVDEFRDLSKRAQTWEAIATRAD
jgi:peptide/nickel transport system ATP-binding protein